MGRGFSLRRLDICVRSAQPPGLMLNEISWPQEEHAGDPALRGPLAGRAWMKVDRGCQAGDRVQCGKMERSRDGRRRRLGTL